MYIRRTLTRTLANGAQYYSHRLVRSERVGGRVRQVTLLNLGSDFALASTQWESLCLRIDDLLAGRASPAIPDQEHERAAVEVEAQRVAALLLARQSSVAPPGEESALESADLCTQQVAGPRSVGVEHVALWAIVQLGLMEQLQTLEMPQRHSTVVVSLIVGRMAALDWALPIRPWCAERSALGELLGVDFQTFGPMVFKRAAEGLWKHHKALEAHIFDRMQDLCGPFDGEPVYLLTNHYLGGADWDDECPGTPRTTHPYTPPGTLGLIVDQRGVIRRSATFSTGAWEERHLKRMLDELGASPGALVAIERGAASKSHLTWLRANGYRSLVGSETGWDDERLKSIGELLADRRRVFASLTSAPGLTAAEQAHEWCDEANLFISVLAYHCVQIIRHRLIGHGIGVASWPILRHILAGHCRVTVSIRLGDGRVLHMRQATRADPEQLAIYQALGIDTAPGGVQKTIV
jgi:hypothetical protein